MGGEISKVNVKSNRITPNFLRHRLHDMRKRRRFSRPTKQTTPSKKELLSYVIEEDGNLEGSLVKREYVIKDHMKKVEAHNDQERVAKLIEAIVQEDEKEEGDHGDVEDDDNNNNKDDQRMIKRTYDEDGPGSPSFRVYFTNNNVEDKKINEVIIGNKDVIKKTTPIAATNRPTSLIAATIPSTEVMPVGRKVKKETKRKSFRSTLSKNMLNVRSSCSTAHSRPSRTHLLLRKAPA